MIPEKHPQYRRSHCPFSLLSADHQVPDGYHNYLDLSARLLCSFDCLVHLYDFLGHCLIQKHRSFCGSYNCKRLSGTDTTTSYPLTTPQNASYSLLDCNPSLTHI